MTRPAADGGHLERQIGRAEMISKLAGGVVNNFNNILAVVLGRVELMLSQVDDGRLEPAQLRRGLLSVQKVTLDAAELLNRLRELTQPPRDLSFGVFDLNTAVLDVLEFVQPHAASVAHTLRSELRLTERLSPTPARVSGQSSALREVLVNLILNAMEAMPTGGEITVGTRHDGSSVVLEVVDTGVGMTDEVLANVFTPFFTTKGAGSTGLGLSSARDLITRHGGTIAVRSRLGHGTSFTITLPGADGPAAEAAVTAQPELPPGLSLLVVEDEPAFGDTLRELFEFKGCEVTILGDGPSALAEIERTRYDVVLTDLLLPVVSGWEIARAAKRRSAATRVVLMSGHPIAEDAELVGGVVDAALLKPLDLTRLLSLIAALTDRPPGPG
ncbi:MAG TPA: ATP-binding protein [Candidatus Limnocylindrales bacterium]|nr:ATP-binding protein [Candidatus Limnocylindrales bacterium]